MVWQDKTTSAQCLMILQAIHVRTYVRTYHFFFFGTYGTRVRTYKHYLKNNLNTCSTRVPWYHGTYMCTHRYVRTNWCVLRTRCTYVRTYMCTYVRTYVPWYTCTYKYNIISKTTWNTSTRVPWYQMVPKWYHLYGIAIPMVPLVLWVHVYFKSFLR